MLCENPVVMRIVGKNKKTGKNIMDYVGHLSNLACFRQDANFTDSKWCYENGYVLIPCGRCTPCRVSYQKHWAERLMIASENVKYKYFITLTYDDDHIDECKTFMYNNNDELVSGFSLVKDHVQLFMKRLRKFANTHNLVDGDHIQYFLCGEYGDLHGRPHYHIILFNFILNDLEIEYCKNGFEYFQSKTIDNIWKKGRTQVCNITYETCSYVAGYTTKKVYGKKAEQYYSDKAVIPEFCLMSRNPAIGRDVYENNKDKIFKDDSMLICRDGKVYDIKPPRYFDKLYEVDSPSRYENVKITRKVRPKYIHSDKYGYAYLSTCATNFKARQKKNKGEL